MGKISRKLRDWLPPVFFRTVAPYLGQRIRFSGNFRHWQEAARACPGYAAEDIVERVCASALKVKEGTAAFERDAMVFAEAQPPYPVLTALMRAAICEQGELRVLDFGGSLGSSYFQCAPFLRDIQCLRWDVIEQAGFVKKGKALFEDDVLRFYDSIDHCESAKDSSVVLLSGVLQYLEKPDDAIQSIIALNAPFIVIDRTPVIEADDKVLVKQIVPARFGRASYPVWLFSRATLLTPFLTRYRITSEFDAVDGIMSYRLKDVSFKGFVLEKD